MYVYRRRIVLIGQERAGKTALKNSLLGLPFDPKGERTEGIEFSACEIVAEVCVFYSSWRHRHNCSFFS